MVLWCESRVGCILFLALSSSLNLGTGFSPQTAVLLLRIDDIVSGHKKKGDDQSKQPAAPEAAQE